MMCLLEDNIIGNLILKYFISIWIVALFSTEQFNFTVEAKFLVHTYIIALCLLQSIMEYYKKCFTQKYNCFLQLL
jgi:hypothetical protein